MVVQRKYKKSKTVKQSDGESERVTVVNVSFFSGFLKFEIFCCCVQ